MAFRRSLLFGGKFLFGTAAVGTTATWGYSYYDPALRRQLEFWKLATPAVIDYGWCSFKNRKLPLQDRLAAFDDLHEVHAKTALQVILKFRGLFIKFGQVASVRPEIVPAAYRREFKRLQSEVPSVQVDLVKKVLEEDFGQSTEELFQEFDEAPVGAASIGQAHRAKLKSTGEQVVVKVQYPDVKRLFQADLQSIKLLFYLVEPDSMQAYDEIAVQLMQELDFENEANNLKTVYSRVMPVFKDRVSIPEVRTDYCSPRVITMTFIEGDKWDDTLLEQLRLLGGEVRENEDFREVMGRQFGKMDVSETEEVLESTMAQVHMTTSTRFENAVQTVGKNVLQWVGTETSMALYRNLIQLYYVGNDMLYFLFESLHQPFRMVFGNRASDWVEQLRKRHQVSRKMRQIVDQLDLLFDVHGYELFTGMVNGDPHPGNILMLPDNRVGLIDYGQCKSLDVDARKKLARVFVSIAKGGSDKEIAECFRDLGVVTENDSDEFLSFFAKISFDKVEAQYLDPRFHMRMHSIDRVREIPAELIMVSRTSALLRGLAMTLGHNKSIAEMWLARAEDFLNSEGQGLKYS